MMDTNKTVFSALEAMPTMRESPLLAAIKRLEKHGREVGLTGDIPGLFRIDGGPEITTNQLISIAQSLPA
jgi:hypothetical protein